MTLEEAIAEVQSDFHTDSLTLMALYRVSQAIAEGDLIQLARAEAAEAEVQALKAERDVLRADRDSAARMWQEAARDLEATIGNLQTARRYLTIETGHAETAEAEVARLRAALENLLDAILAQDRHGDRSLTITGSTANLKWLLEAEDDARAALTTPAKGDAE